MSNEIITIQGIGCYEKDGVAYLNLEACARGLGFTETAGSGNECVRWRTVRKYLGELGIATSCDGAIPDYIPENIFYRLAMKAKNETAERFQALVADEIIPSIRKHGAYLAPETVERILHDPDTIIRLATTIKEERAKRLHLQAENEQMKPKADYFDELVERGINTSFRITAKELQVRERAFVDYLIQRRYIFKDKKGRLMPYAEHVKSGLFVVKECISEHNSWKGTQTLITPKGRATFRLLTKNIAS